MSNAKAPWKLCLLKNALLTTSFFTIKHTSCLDALYLFVVLFIFSFVNVCIPSYAPTDPRSSNDIITESKISISVMQLFEELQNLLAVKKDLEPEYSCRVVQRIHEDVPEEVLPLDIRVECNSKIAVALSLMDECFLPIVDQRTGINLIRNVVYSCGYASIFLQGHRNPCSFKYPLYNVQAVDTMAF